MIDLKDGSIIIDNRIKLSPIFSFSKFKLSTLYSRQNPEKFIYIKEPVSIKEKLFYLSLKFENEKLIHIQLMIADYSISFEEEEERKIIHDNLLKKFNILQNKEYEWGKIKSTYDPKGNCSHIHIIYK